MFDNEKIMEAAQKLGLEIKFNSDNPGFHLKNSKNETVSYFDFEAIAAQISERLYKNSSNNETITFDDE